MKRNSKIFILTLYRSKNSFAHFGKIKINKKIKKYFTNFFFVDCSLMYKRGLCKNFKIKYFLRSQWFFKFESLPRIRRARQKLPIFWNWVPENIPDQQKCVRFQKSRKSAKSLHPTGGDTILSCTPTFNAKFCITLYYFWNVLFPSWVDSTRPCNFSYRTTVHI